MIDHAMASESVASPQGRATAEAATSVTAPVGRRPSVVAQPAIGGTLGRYVVVQEVGRGGMGSVLRAYDPKLQREVALKVLLEGALGSAETRRLVAEARALAKLSHPNVVGVYDVEVVADDPRGDRLVLAMEFVEGTTLSGWSKASSRPWREVVRMFMAAGRGLEAAHVAGLLHRDFKPANVLVSTDGSVKVTDFGLAKFRGVPTGGGQSYDGAPRPDATAQERLTAAGTVMGTPRYMAPEQHTAQPLTPAADQFAFCVALWEALVGAPPFSGSAIAQQKFAGPPKLPASSGDRRVPRVLLEVLRRGMSPAPESRWPSLSALLDAIAYDPARRRRRFLFAGVGGAGVVAVALLGQSWAAAAATRCSGAADQLTAAWGEAQRDRVRGGVLAVDVPFAARTWERLEVGLDAYARDWSRHYTDACEATTIRGEQSSEALDRRMACLQRARTELEAVTAVLAGADTTVVRRAHRLLGGLPPLSRCADVTALQAEVEPPLPTEAGPVDRARTHLAAARAALTAGRYDAAQTELDLVRPIASAVRYPPVRIELAVLDGRTSDALGDFEAAERSYRDAVVAASSARQVHALSNAAAHLMYVIGYRQQRFAEGLAYRFVALGAANGEADDEAAARNNIAVVLGANGDRVEAEAEHRRALALRKGLLGEHHLDVAKSHNNLAIVLWQQGRLEEAEAEHRSSLAIRLAELGPDHPDVASSRSNLAGVLVAMGRLSEAELEQRRAIAIEEGALGPDHPDIAMARGNLGILLRAQGKLDEAEGEFRQALTIGEASLRPDHPDVAAAHDNLASILFEQGRVEDGEAEARHALALWEKALDPEHPDLAISRRGLATILLDRGKQAEARPLARAAWQRLQRSDVPRAERVSSAFELARATSRTDRPSPDELRTRAAAAYREAGVSWEADADAIEAWARGRPR